MLATFRPCFTAPTFEVFTALVAGLVAQPVSRTVCGMLTGAGLARVWHHCRAHRFFSAARWCPQRVGLVLAELIVTCLLAPGASITVAVDDTLFGRRGKKVHAAGWFHDGSAAGQTKLGYGNNWVVVAIIVTLPFVSRPVALPVLAALAVKGGSSKPDLARDLIDLIAERFADRDIHIVADAAYGCRAFIGLGDGMTMTTRVKANAVFSQLAPPRTGKRGRPRLKGDRIGTPADIAGSATWRTVRVSRYGTTSTVQITEQVCLWYGTWRTDTVQVILVRETGKKAVPAKGYGIALVTTDLEATAEEIIARRGTDRSIRTSLSQHPDHLVRAARPQPHRHSPASRLGTLVQAQNRTLHLGHARQAPTPDHRRPISTHLTPTSHNPRNPGSPASLGSSRRMKCKSRGLRPRRV
ncbi:transposase [Actinophytocola sp.]|uniref:IS701 family transposase n=1 Tax=Actinophytocola sp. TaxID=1872138 RepID=UPI0025BAF800|nr:transposase [Actinophytocola sp.]